MPDEDFWQNWTAPTPLTVGKLYLPETEEIPAATLYGNGRGYHVRAKRSSGSHGQPDEDLWVNWVSPVSLTLQWPQQWQFEQNESPTLHGQPDEDLWINPVSPAQNTLTWPQQWAFEQNEPGNLSGQPDEDYWVNSVKPLQSTLLWPQQWTFEQHEPAGSLYGVLDDGTWVNLPQSLAPWTSQPFLSDVEFAYQITVAEEDYWQNMVSPQTIGIILLQQWAFDDGGLPITPVPSTASLVIWIVDDFG